MILRGTRVKPLPPVLVLENGPGMPDPHKQRLCRSGIRLVRLQAMCNKPFSVCRTT